MSDRISSAQAAARLGVKLETLYAYVSRGLLLSEREAGVRGTTFDVAEVEHLARSGTRRGGRPVSVLPFKSVASTVSTVEAGTLRYRGLDAVELSRRGDGFRAAAGWVLAADDALDWSPRPAVVRAARAAAAAPALGQLRGAGRLRVLLTVAGAADPLRHDLRPQAALRAVATAVAVLAPAGADGAEPGAARLWPAVAADAAVARAADAALVLCMDHGLATSTVAARVAASVRADPYACLCAALSAFESPLHGRAGRAAQELLAAVICGEPAERVVEEALRSGSGVPGFGHRLYPAGDPRAAEILSLLEPASAASGPLAAVAALQDVLDTAPNVDLALAALCLAAGLPADAGEELFATARAVGWSAHALEEYGEAPLRWRGQGA